MGIQNILLSKLIKACELDWIPDTDAIYGEPAFTKQLPKGLKKLVYDPKRKRNAQESLRTTVTRKRLTSNKNRK